MSSDVIASFVVEFGKRGNQVIAQYPPDLDLELLQFKAIASGQHNLENDIVYFRKGPYYGVSVFKNIKVQSEEERGARMKSVAVLCNHYSSLYLHIPFLKRQIDKALEDEPNYAALLAYPASPNLSQPEEEEGDEMYTSKVQDLHILNPIGFFDQFVKYYGPAVFTLWKAVILKMRVMFYSPPPVEAQCYRVFCTCLLGNHTIPYAYEVKPDPLFYVEVNDIGPLSTMSNYIACTTEKIFEQKKNLYDVFVNKQMITSEFHPELIKVSETDKKNYKRLEVIMSNSNLNIQAEIKEFFSQMTSNLFRQITEALSSDEKVFTIERFELAQLDVKHDAWFVAKVCEIYDVDIEVEQGSSYPSLTDACCKGGYTPLA